MSIRLLDIQVGNEKRGLSSTYFLLSLVFCLKCAELLRSPQILEIVANINGNPNVAQITMRAFVSVSGFSFIM